MIQGKLVFIHYTPPGVIGGVEHILFQHAHELQKRGFTVSIVAGRAGESDAAFDVIPEIDVASPENVVLEAELASGVVGPRFWDTRRRIMTALESLLADARIVVVHNAFTLHFSLPLTSVLWELAGTTFRGRVLAWTHDLSWSNPLYVSMMSQGYPWDLLRRQAPGARYVAISRERRDEMWALWEDAGTDIAVVPNGIDARTFLRLSPTALEIAESYSLLDRDLVLLLPVRITRRKNVELGIRALRSLVDRGIDAIFLISGPEAPHHPQRSRTYLSELQDLSAELDIADRVIFLSQERGENLPAEVVSEIYSVADALLFPSQSEGFGLPILEAGLARLPAILSDIPIFRELGLDDARYVGLEWDPDTIAETILEALQAPSSRLYRRVLREFSWDRVIGRDIVPLLTLPGTEG